MNVRRFVWTDCRLFLLYEISLAAYCIFIAVKALIYIAYYIYVYKVIIELSY